MRVHEGSCLCGAIRYETRGEPVRVTICHCRFCQRATGTGHMAEPVFEGAEFTVTHGMPATYSLRSEGSGKETYVHFCAACGTKLWLSFDRSAGFIRLYAGTLDAPDWIVIEPETSKRVFLDMAWLDAVILPHVNVFGQHATLNDGAPLQPHVFDHPVTVAESWPPKDV